MSDKPKFHYPKDTFIGSRERLDYYSRELWHATGIEDALINFVYGLIKTINYLNKRKRLLDVLLYILLLLFVALVFTARH